MDTSPEFHGEIIGTRTYQNRLQTLDAVRKAGITVCCGGILGMRESDEDRIGLLQQLANLHPHPESVPINMLVRADVTPLGRRKPLDPLIMVRTIATARILMPTAMIRLAAGRTLMAREAVLHDLQGRGLAAEAEIVNEVLAIVHTCGKALASMGAFVCSGYTLKQFLINRARTFVFSTAMPPY